MKTLSGDRFTTEPLAGTVLFTVECANAGDEDMIIAAPSVSALRNLAMLSFLLPGV
jgi:hypothetical protein